MPRHETGFAGLTSNPATHAPRGLPPIPGTTKEHRLAENLGAADIALSATELQDIIAAAAQMQAAGARYAPAQMAMVGRDAPPVAGKL
ncbi:MAG: hypothetical protein POH28_00100 [Acidocella sp.]|nr:hypothetical protein [Acidocella sp.]